uniref:Aspartic proteinase-like protein 2 n=1 Tax=Tanacetum cinerariifolium TaxID=118510 RepID=A0A6L2L6F5_TANCI|nr:aspartic proteinase-like protein 2 [Tanacetum cinerariifolium]
MISFIESWLLSMTPIKKLLLRMLKKSKPQENGMLQRQIGGEEKGGIPGSIVARITTTLSFFGIVVTMILQGMVVLCKYPLSLKLERDFPHGDQMKLPELRDRDILRHFQLGSPPKESYVQFDNGSDVLWANCKDCKGCSTSSGLKIPIPMVLYDPLSSSTSSLISCLDKTCSFGNESSDAGYGKHNRCIYSFKYGDGSATSGYFVSDVVHLE